MGEALFREIRSVEVAYLLGWLATSEARPAGRISFTVRRGASNLSLLSSHLGRPVEEAPQRRKVRLTFYAPEIVRELWATMGRGPLLLPSFSDASLTWAFLRGHAEHSGRISSPKRARELSVSMAGGGAFQESLRAFCEIPFVAKEDGVVFYGSNALDLLSKLYEGEGPFLRRSRRRFWRWCSLVPGLTRPDREGLVFRWYKLSPEAQPPRKERASDSGYDLTLLRAVRTVGATTFFSTGVQVEPAYGWYFDLVPRSSISKTGYMLANNVGVIDRSYRGEILIPLIKVDPAAAEIVLPSRLVQLIPRPIIHATLQEAPLGESARGERGFGSSGT